MLDRIFYNSKCVPFGSSCEGESISCNDGELQGNLEYQYSKCYSCNVGYDCVEKCILKNIDFESDSPGQCPQNWDCTGSSRISSPSNRNCAAPGNLQGQHYFEVGCDHTIGTATSYNFYLPEDIHKITFLRAGGSDSGSGFYLKRASNDEILCSAETGTNTDTFFVDFCEDLEEHAETEVYIFLRDIQTGGWSKVYIDDIRFITNS